jgi:hypothetical protein
MARPTLVCALAIVLAAGILAAAPLTNIHRIDLVDGGRILSLDEPVRSGTIFTFHRYPSGELSGVPAELVEGIARARVSSSPAGGIAVSSPAPPSREGKELEPGELVVLASPTGEGAPQTETSEAAASAPGPQTPPIWNGYFYGGGGPLRTPNVVLPPGTTVGTDGLLRVLSTTDMAVNAAAASAASASSSPVAPNGFPATVGAAVVIGPNGMPVMIPQNGVASTPAVLPDGTIVGATGTEVIGRNGTPVLGTVPASPVIGPNGTPILAPPGQPGSTPPTIGPNGTPVLAPSGQPGSSALSTAPNGTPSSPARSGAPAGSSAAPSGSSGPH